LKITEKLVQQVVQTLLSSQQTLSFAESCSGGLLSVQITELSGVSAVFMGSVVSYSNEAKVEILGVGLGSLQLQGAVSQIVAQEMAQGVRHRFHTDWGVSITGIAGPTGGSAEKPVGTVWIAVCGPLLASGIGGRTQTIGRADCQQRGSDRADSKKGRAADNPESSNLSESFVEARKYFFKGNRREIQEQAVQSALELLLEALS
jgi:PncC family amidohydrolase